MLIGRDNLIKLFKKLAGDDKLSHAYLFFGEPQVGKFLFALSLANYLERKKFQVEKNVLLEEILIIFPDENGTIGIDAAKSAIDFLARKPVFSKKRIVLIRDAENMTPHAQNAILKLIEEPPQEALIILIAANNDLLLPALISRLQKIYFQRVDKKEIEKMLIEIKINEQKAKLLAEESFGRPGRAIASLKIKNVKFNLNEIINNGDIDEFFENKLIELRNSGYKDINLAKETLKRLVLIKTLNVNKKLQLKAISSKI